MTISEDVHDSGRTLASADDAQLEDCVNHAINRFIGDSYRAEAGLLIDQEGDKSQRIGSVIHLASETTDPRKLELPADSVAGIFDVCSELDLETLRSAYNRIAEAKRLKKTPIPKGETRTNITLGIIFAARSRVPLEIIAEELERLNSLTPSNQWPDMISVASTGVINYAIQFPGETISGDFLPPAEGALSSSSPPMYVQIVLRPTGTFAFNKTLAFLLAHLGIYSPKVSLPMWGKFLDGVNKNVMTSTGFQYNLKGDLLPVPREFYNDRYIPPRPLLIQDPKGNVLSTIQFMPWQDGGIILLRGTLPLEGLLIFLGKNQFRGGVIKLSDLQISYVLPISLADFNNFLGRFQKQSNMTVTSEPGHFIVQKLEDEGTTSPFMARIFLEILKLRDAVYPDPNKRERFDKLYDSVTSAVSNARTASKNIIRIWDNHNRKIASGKIVRRQGTHIQIGENVDRELRREFESFLNASTRALKAGMQNQGQYLDIDIGFLFKKPATFERGIDSLKKTEPERAEYLRQTRKWSEPLIRCRNDLEHEVGVLPRISYKTTDSDVIAVEPITAGVPITQFVGFTFDRLICFVEEFTAHCLQQCMAPGITITERTPADRNPEAPERFIVTLAIGGHPAWVIEYHETRFEEV